MTAPKGGDQRALLDACVHCGFCLPTCPTYLLTGQEAESPRGRIYLMRAHADGRTAMTPAWVGHMDSCLGCEACVTACPSGVEYGPLIEHTRAAIETGPPRSIADRAFRGALFSVLPYPGRLRVLAAALGVAGPLGRRLGASLARAGWFPRIAATLSLAPPAPRPAVPRTPLNARVPTRGRVGLVTGCVQRVFFAHVNDATIRVLTALGYEAVVPGDQGCCGALSVHAGRDSEARALARRLIEAFERAGVERVCVNVAGCGSVLKEYGRLLADDPEWAARARAFAAKVSDVSELADDPALAAALHPLPLSVAYHDACHLAHAQGIREAPRRMLARIPGLTVVPLAESDTCCGSAGIYNLAHPATARQLGDRKAARIDEAAPDVVVTGNPGCLLQIAAASSRAGRQRPVLHTIELVDASLAGTGADAVRRGVE